MQSKSSELLHIKPEALQGARKPLRKFSVAEQMTEALESEYSHLQLQHSAFQPFVFFLSLSFSLFFFFSVFLEPFSEPSVSDHRFFGIVYYSTCLAQFYKLRCIISNNWFLKINCIFQNCPQTHRIISTNISVPYLAINIYLIVLLIDLFCKVSLPIFAVSN